MFSRSLRLAYRELISNHRDRVSFWVLVGFLITYITARLLVKAYPALFFHIHGVHVHHFTYGIFVLAITGFLSLTKPGAAPDWLAAFYGLGLALAFDEFAMWVRLTDSYSLYRSENAMVIILVLLLTVVYLITWLKRAVHHIRN
ncbi:MAG TPA: hypothetical protein VNX65_01845 [Patescibacteria group bacterium]|jgi:hypothetical protein|nr:hypothetical protein [Patescibacteria group bacterium]